MRRAPRPHDGGIGRSSASARPPRERPRRGGPPGLRGDARAAGILLFLPRLHGSPLRSRPRFLTGPPSGRPGREGSGGRRPPRGGASLAAHQDDPGGGRPRRGGCAEAPGPPARRVRGGGGGDGRRLPGLLPVGLRAADAPRPLFRAARGCPERAGGRLLRSRSRPLVRAPPVRAGLPAGPGWPGGVPPAERRGLAPPARGLLRSRSRPDLADVVGRTVSARAIPRAPRSLPGRRSRRAGGGGFAGADALAGGLDRGGLRARAPHDRRSGPAAAPQPRQPSHPPVGRARRRGAARAVPSRADRSGRRRGASGRALGTGAAGALRPRWSRRGPGASRPAVPRPRAAPAALPGRRSRRRPVGPPRPGSHRGPAAARSRRRRTAG